MTAAVETGHHSLAQKLYHGETSFDFVGRWRRWFAISGTIIVLGMLALGIKGLNFGIDFKGGTSWELPAHGVSIQKASGALGPAFTASQITRHRAFGDLKAQHQQFTVDSRSAPGRILARHTPDDLEDIGVDLPPASTRAQAPEEPESRAMPADYCLGPDHDKRIAPSRPKSAQCNPEHAVQVIESRSRAFAPGGVDCGRGWVGYRSEGGERPACPWVFEERGCERSVCPWVLGFHRTRILTTLTLKSTAELIRYALQNRPAE